MKKIQAFLGYFTAALMIPLAVLVMVGMQPISEWLVEVTGIQVSPLYTGGEVRQTLPNKGPKGPYETRVHRPVFDGLFGERSEGFVQVVWGPAGRLPETVREEIDYDGDGQADFAVTLRPRAKTAEWKPLNEHAVSIEGPYAIGDGLGVRIGLKK